MCESSFQHHEHKSEISCHDKQENLHQIVVFPLAENEDNQDLNVESHVLPPMDNKGEYGDCQSSCSSDLSFSQSLFQEDNIQEVFFLDTLEKQDHIFYQMHEELKVAGCHENEFTNHLVEEEDVVPFSFIDNSTDHFDSPRYDEYNDGFLEKPILYASSKGYSFQEASDNIQPTCHSYNMVREENNEIAKGNSLPLCFSSFKFLKESFKIINKEQ